MHFQSKSLIEYSEEDYFCDLNAQFLALPKNAQDVRVNEIIRTGLEIFLKHLCLYILDSFGLEMILAFRRI